MNEKVIYTLIALILVAVSGYIIYQTLNSDPYSKIERSSSGRIAGDVQKTKPTPTAKYDWNEAKMEMSSVTINDTTVYVTIADNNQERAKGLSGRRVLNEDEGMLFLYDRPTLPAFWMYNMNFDLDIIWINDGEVVDITENVPAPPPGTPRSELKTYSPSTSVDAVLEVNAGFARNNDFRIGDSAILPE